METQDSTKSTLTAASSSPDPRGRDGGARLADDEQVVSVYARVAFDHALAITDILVSESAKLR
jgi:hypothetical protein